MNTGKWLFATAATALIAALVWLRFIKPRQMLVLIPCLPMLVNNGSFEASKFNGVGLVELNDANNCVGTDSCLDDWAIKILPNKLQWWQNGNGTTGIPPAAQGGGMRFIDLSGSQDKPEFPTVMTKSKIHLDPGSYYLQFMLGQGNGENNMIRPVSVNATITGAITDKPHPPFQTDVNGDSWQRVTWVFHSNGGDIQLSFSAPLGQTAHFIGLDSVSLVQLIPIPDCKTPLSP
jgi:hypothetical protein